MSTEPARPVAHLDSFNWLEIERELDERGVAVLPGLLTQFQCEEVQRFYPQADHFRREIAHGRVLAFTSNCQSLERGHGY